MVQQFVRDVAVNLLSQLIGWLILSIIVVTALLILRRSKRQKLLRFFGISNTKPQLKIYTSHLQVQKDGTVGFDELTSGYEGPALSRLEYKAALLTRDLFQGRLLEDLPGSIRAWLASRFVAFRDMDVGIDVSPLKEAEIDYDGNLIVIGSNVYNLLTKHYQDIGLASFQNIRLEDGERAFVITRGDLKDEDKKLKREGNTEYGVVERFKDNQHGITVVICAGQSASSSFGSARYLVEHWKELDSKYHDMDFSVFLKFKGQREDAESVVTPIVVYSYPS